MKNITWNKWDQVSAQFTEAPVFRVYRVYTVYRGSSFQRGHGLASFFGGLFRYVLPMLKSGAKALSREALNTGLNVLSDLDGGVSLKEAARSRIKEAGNNFKNNVLKLTGGGRKRQSTSRPRRVKKKKTKKSTSSPRDIFSRK